MKGHYVAYQPKKFQQKALDEIKAANLIIEEYEGKGFAMSLRQLYYQMVARGMRENSKPSYDRLKTLISDGRLAGLVSWTAIEDRGRNLMGHQTFDGPHQAIKWLAKEHYRIDLWTDQPFRPEVWVEKAAQEGTVGQICNQLRVDFFSCKGLPTHNLNNGARDDGLLATSPRARHLSCSTWAITILVALT